MDKRIYKQAKRIYSGLLIITLSLLIGGCALGKAGKAEVGYFTISLPDDLKGRSKAEIIHKLGIPEHLVTEGETEYWGYSNKGGWYLYIPITNAGGVTQAKNLILEFKGNRLAYAYLYEKGLSWGLVTPQGSFDN